jgi:excisionase family DNA binding protein
MLEDKDWVVDVRLSYRVKAASPDAALGAVLPLLSLGRDRYGPQPDVADYTVHESLHLAAETSPKALPPGLSKSVYTAKEVAEILNISTASVYEKIPCMRIGGSRRYSRAVILEILERGSIPEPQRPVPVYHERHRPEKPPKVVSKAPPIPKPFMTISEVAKTLRLSPYKIRQLLDAKKIHYFETQGGGRNIRRDAVAHYVNGGTPRQFLERVLAESQDAGQFRDDPTKFERIAAEWRAMWPEDERR